MKRYLLTALLFLVFANAFAQDRAWRFGIKSGIGESGISGSKLTDNTVFDKYQRGTTFSFGLRVSYGFLKHFAIVADPEFQVLRDSRLQTIPGYAVPIAENVTYTNYHNRFQRLQLPVGLQYHPFLWKVKPYASAGILPYYITQGKMTERTTHTNIPGEIFETVRKADFSIDANQEIRSAAPFFAGVGLGIGKHIRMEVTKTFSKKMDIQLDNPLPTFRMPQMGHNYALRNTRFALILQL